MKTWDGGAPGVVADRCDVSGGMKTWDGVRLG